MRIGEVARQAGVRVSLIRYYEEIGLLAAADRVSGQRRYDETVLRRLAVIDVAQRAGLALDEIRELLEHGNDPMNERLSALAGHAESLRRAIERTVDSYNKFAASLESRVLVTARQFPGIDETKIIDEAQPIHTSPRKLTALELEPTLIDARQELSA